ncbi:MAG TPA: VOC family protein [Steroidobacteraceae bacterium]|jgi:catechol 2,3-dioxygenase-like lactoylglutathione lyase family enzyme|nr:VOC family protein [Steroidobacteraceae bacterium]
MAQLAKLPSRLHHTAYVTKDQEKTRRFYEDVIGLPLLATWCESDELFGKVRTYVHTFFGIGDGGALAFFQFADPEDQAEFGPKMPPTPFHHIALKVDAQAQAEIEARIAKAGIKPPDTYVLEHGYCRSVYVADPNGLILEFTRDHPDVEKIGRDRRADAHQALKRWLAGDHTSNNTYR